MPGMRTDRRGEVDDKKIAPWTQRVAFKLLARLLQHPRLYRFAAKAGRIMQKPFASDGRIGRLPLFFGEWTRTRDLPPVASRTFQERWASEKDLQA